jgi:predicted nucleic acid-binding protein
VSGPRLIVAEPGPAYLHRPKLVVDASVVVAILFGEPTADEAHGWLRGRALCAPQTLDAEVTSAGLNKIRRRTLDLKQVAAAIENYSTFDVERYSIAPTAVLALAARYALSAYDACYLWLAESLGAPLATFDARLGEAAQRHLGGARGPG